VNCISTGILNQINIAIQMSSFAHASSIISGTKRIPLSISRRDIERPSKPVCDDAEEYSAHRKRKRCVLSYVPKQTARQDVNLAFRASTKPSQTGSIDCPGVLPLCWTMWFGAWREPDGVLPFRFQTTQRHSAHAKIFNMRYYKIG
jgi:hypothetical protein